MDDKLFNYPNVNTVWLSLEWAYYSSKVANWSNLSQLEFFPHNTGTGIFKSQVCFYVGKSEYISGMVPVIWIGKYSILYISEGTDEIIQCFKAYPKCCKHFLAWNSILYSNKRWSITFKVKYGWIFLLWWKQWLKVRFMGSKFLGCFVVPPFTKI